MRYPLAPERRKESSIHLQFPYTCTYVQYTYIYIYMYIRTIYVYIYVYTYNIRIYISKSVQYTYIYIYRKAYGYREKILHFRIGVAKKRGSDGRSGGSPLKRRREGGAGEGGATEERRKEGDTACYYLAGGGKRRLRWAHLASQDIFPPFMALGPSFFQPLRAALITAGLKGWYLWYTGAF